MTALASRRLSKSHAWQRFGHVALAIGLTLLLLVFLVFARWLDAQRSPDQVIRLVDVTPPVALPAPPPPPASDEEPQPDLPPPPPMKVELPHLELQIEAVAPALAARLDPRIDLSMQTAIFDLEVDPPPAVKTAPVKSTVGRTTTPPARTIAKSTPAPVPAVRSTYDAGELDAKPRLVNRPSASYPRDQLRAGVEGGQGVIGGQHQYQREGYGQAGDRQQSRRLYGDGEAVCLAGTVFGAEEEWPCGDGDLSLASHTATLK